MQHMYQPFIVQWLQMYVMTNLTLKLPALSPHGACGSAEGAYCPKQLQSTGLFIETLRFSCELGTEFFKYNLD